MYDVKRLDASRMLRTRAGSTGGVSPGRGLTWCINALEPKGMDSRMVAAGTLGQVG
jgi:hypothetical protein